MLLFAQRNPKSCPVLAVLEAGETTDALLAGGDIRADVPRYTVYEHGVLVDEPTDLAAWWRDDLVTFIVGCSFTFETALQDGGIPIAHIDQGVNVPMYTTTARSNSAGSLCGPMMISMRPIMPGQVADAVRISTRFLAVHGAPVHGRRLGAAGYHRPVPPGRRRPGGDAARRDPRVLGLRCDPAGRGDGVEATGGHRPRAGHMLVTDARDSDYFVP